MWPEPSWIITNSTTSSVTTDQLTFKGKDVLRLDDSKYC